MMSVLVIAGKKIDFITAGGRVSVSNTLLGHCWVFDSCGELKKRFCLFVFLLQTTAYVPELQKLSGKDAEKAAKAKPAKRGGAKSKEDDEEEELEKEDDSAKPKNQKPKGRGKKPALKRKTKDSEDEDDDADGEEDESDAEEEVVKPRGRGTKAAIKKKPEEKAGNKKPKGRRS